MSSPPSLSQSEVSIICVNQSECIKCGGERAVKIGNFEGRHSLGGLGQSLDQSLKSLHSIISCKIHEKSPVVCQGEARIMLCESL